jgi:serine/threonine protein kinase
VKQRRIQEQGVVKQGMSEVPAAGPKVGGYRLGRRLGAGAFGTVWSAAHEHSGAQVAVKILHPKYIDQPANTGPSICDRFLTEARLLQTIKHPGVVRVLDIIDDRSHDTIAYVMEKLTGRDLKALNREMALSLIVDVFAQVAESLEIVHKQGILHRDIKLANIFVCDPPPHDRGDRRVKLIDFGVAKDLTDASLLNHTAMGAIHGTLSHMAPECFLRISDPQVQLTAAVDQWSLGVALYQALSGGKRPFSAPALAVSVQVIQDPPTPLVMAARFGWAHVPADLDRLILRCLNKAPGDRYPSLSQVAEELRTVNEELIYDESFDDPRQLFVGLATSLEARPVDSEMPLPTLINDPAHEAPTQLAEGMAASVRAPQIMDTLRLVPQAVRHPLPPILAPVSATPSPHRAWTWLGLSLAMVAVFFIGWFLRAANL